MKRMLIVSDLHCGHRVGLTPPQFDHEKNESLPHHRQAQYQTRRKLWDWFDTHVKEALGEEKLFDYMLCVGDAIDGPGDKNRGTDLLHTDLDDQVTQASWILTNIPAEHRFFVHGTGSHEGKAEEFGRHVADSIGAECLPAFEAEIGGVLMQARHHISGTSSLPSEMTPLVNAKIKQDAWQKSLEAEPFNLMVRGHSHRCRGAIFPRTRQQVWTTPALQGFGSKYSRDMDGLPVDFGIMLVTFYGGMRYNVEPIVSPLKIQRNGGIKVLW
jgi:hypothetical protein